MRPDIFTFLVKKQDTYWWNRARRSMGEALLRSYGAPTSGRWLDLGCGSGGNLGVANRFAPYLVVGADLSELGLELTHSVSPQATLVRSDISRGLPFGESTFDVVTIFNVLYHEWVEDDGRALCEVARILQVGGLLLITEPAFPILARQWDRAVMGARRYRRPELIALCQRAGLKVLFASYFTSFGFPILIGIMTLRRIRRLIAGAAVTAEKSSEHKLLCPVLNQLLYAAAMLEAKAISAGAAFPFGVTLVLVAAKS